MDRFSACVAEPDLVKACKAAFRELEGGPNSDISVRKAIRCFYSQSGSRVVYRMRRPAPAEPATSNECIARAIGRPHLGHLSAQGHQVHLVGCWALTDCKELQAAACTVRIVWYGCTCSIITTCEAAFWELQGPSSHISVREVIRSEGCWALTD